MHLPMPLFPSINTISETVNSQNESKGILLYKISLNTEFVGQSR